MVDMSDEDLAIIARDGGGEAQRVARQAVSQKRRLSANKRREQVHDAAAKAIAAVTGYPLDVRREGLELARKMLGRR